MNYIDKVMRDTTFQEPVIREAFNDYFNADFDPCAYEGRDAVELDTRRVSTRFMNGVKERDGVIACLLADRYGWAALAECPISFDDIIFSHGFSAAIERGMLPTLAITSATGFRSDSHEWHHFIYNDECYIMYFE